MVIFHHIAVLFFTLTALPFSAQAEDFTNFTADKVGGLYIKQGNGLIINIPAKQTHEVVRNLQGYHSELYAQQRKCTDDVENSQIKTKDTLIAIILPGGLLYLAGKKQQNIQAKEDLENVNMQLSNLESDLDLLKIAISRESVAMLK